MRKGRSVENIQRTAEPTAAVGRAGMTFFPGMESSQPARQLSYSVRPRRAHRVAEAVEWYIAITALVVGASHVARPRDWAEAFRQLPRCGRPGALANGVLSLGSVRKLDFSKG